MLEGGFILLHRSILRWEWYGDLNTARLFIHLLLTVNYEPQRWQGIAVERGQRVASMAKLADETGLTVKQVRTALEHLKRTGEVTHKATSKYGLFTVNHYDRYQPRGEPEGTPQGMENGIQGAGGGQAKGSNGRKNKKAENDVLGGLQRGCLYIIAARPGDGKTDFALHLAVQLAKRCRVDYRSLEMTKETTQGGERMIFEDIANVMNARPVKEIMRKTGLTKNRVYSLRMGCTFHMDYELLFALQRMGYEVRVFAVGDPARRSRDGDGKIPAPVGPVTVRAVSRSEMEPNGDKRRGASAGPHLSEAKMG